MIVPTKDDLMCIWHALAGGIDEGRLWARHSVCTQQFVKRLIKYRDPLPSRASLAERMAAALQYTETQEERDFLTTLIAMEML